MQRTGRQSQASNYQDCPLGGCLQRVIRANVLPGRPIIITIIIIIIMMMMIIMIMMMMMMMIIIIIIITIIIIIIIIIALKGAIRFFFKQSPHCAANCLQHGSSSGPGAIVCKSRAAH